MNSKTKEYRQKIAETFIKSLEENQLGWKKQWQGQAMIPINAINNKPYKGINKFWLSMAAMDRGTDDPRWCTFNQIQTKGWKLNKGAKGEKVEYWMPFDKAAKKGITWDEFRKRSIARDESVTLASRYYTVFNAKDIEGIPLLPPLETKEINPDEIIEKLAQNMEVEIINDGGDRAFYRPLEDKIHLPKPEYFETDYAYNSTALHELAHATGAAHRLNRNIMNMFGSSDYAYEELIAEISSCFMSVNLKMEQDEIHVDNHKAYVQGWIKAIKEKPDTLIKAIREAEKTANYMEYKAELLSEKEYHETINESIEVDEKDIVEQPINQNQKENREVAYSVPTQNVEKTFAEMKEDIIKILAKDGHKLLLCDDDVKDCIVEKAYEDLTTKKSSKEVKKELKEYLQNHILKEESMLQTIKAKGTSSEKTVGARPLDKEVER